MGGSRRRKAKRKKRMMRMDKLVLAQFFFSIKHLTSLHTTHSCKRKEP